MLELVLINEAASHALLFCQNPIERIAGSFVTMETGAVALTKIAWMGLGYVDPFFIKNSDIAAIPLGPCSVVSAMHTLLLS